jgi:hypothetical protein
MKIINIILATLTFVFTVSIFANEKITIDSQNNSILIDAQAVEGITTSQGGFADAHDIKIGTLRSLGVVEHDNKLKIDLLKSDKKLDSIYLNSGRILRLNRESVSAAMGGEMGGGGK